MEKVRIGVPMSDPDNLPFAFVALIKGKHVGKEVEFVQMEADKYDYEAHDRLCEELNIDEVALIGPKPYPTQALARGVPHLIFTADGEVRKLVSLEPETEPY